MYIGKEELGNKVIEDALSFVNRGYECKSIQMVSDVKWTADESFSEYSMSEQDIKDVLSYINKTMIGDGYSLYAIPYTKDIPYTINSCILGGVDSYKINFDIDTVYANCILQDSDDYEGVVDTYAYLKEVK